MQAWAIALGYQGDRQWVKDFGASDKSQAVYEVAAWLDSLGLKLTVSVKQLEQA
jgi:hypothetical protein